MAISRQQKEELVNQYKDWMDRSQAFFLTEYTGLTMKDLDNMRDRIRKAGGEFHIVKNTLCKVAFDEAGLAYPDDLLIGSTAIAFAFDAAPDMAKALTDFAKESEFVKVKSGYLAGQLISQAEVKALADLPPLPVMRAQLLGTIMAPASKLVRTLAEPARQVAAVLQAYADKDASPVEA